MEQRAMAAKQFLKNQTKKVTEYFKPTEKVRARDVIREVPGAVGQMFSGTRDTVVKGGKILGEGLAYATSPNVRKMYQAGNTNILPTVSNTTPRQMLANTAKSAFEIAPVGKIRGLATAAMSAKLAPRMIAGGAMGYGYDVADKMSRPEPISQSTFHPGIATLAGALMGGMSRPTTEMLGQAGREIGNDVRNINPANRLSHRIVDKYDYEPVPGVYAAGGIQQQRPVMESFRKEIETTQRPYNPQSYIAKVLMGKQSPVGNTVQAVDNPLLQEAGKYKTTINLQDKDDVAYLRQIFSDDIVNEIKSGKTTNWRGENYSDIARVNLISEVPQTVEQKLAGKIKDAKLNSDTFYHGTSSGSADSIMASGFKPGSKLPANAYRGGGYGKTQSTVSFAETPKEAGIFSTLTKDGKIVEAKLKPNARVVSIDGIEDAVDLEDYIGYLRKQKIDAVYIGGGEKELVVINPKAATPIKSQLTDLYNKAQGGVESPLLQEAGKYKSAEEFVKSQKPVFRSSKEPFDPKKMGEDGIFTARERGTAERYQKSQPGYGDVEELYIAPDANIMPREKIPSRFIHEEDGINFTSLDEQADLIKYVKEKGYDGYENHGVVHGKIQDPEVQVWNPEKIRTKSQLTDLYNKAHKK